MKGMDMTTLREFIEIRKKEIRSHIKMLRQELKELNTAKAALEQGGGRKNGRKKLTIKEKIIFILNDIGRGSANEILNEIERKFGEKVPRPSLSPQLSRLRKEKRLDFQDGLWMILEKESASDSDPEADNPIHGAGSVREMGVTSSAPKGSNPFSSTENRQEYDHKEPDDLDDLPF